MLKVWHNVNGHNTYHNVSSPAHAMTLIDSLTASDLLDKSVTFNAFGLLDHDGTEWYDDEGNDILDLLDNRD